MQLHMLGCSQTNTMKTKLKYTMVCAGEVPPQLEAAAVKEELAASQPEVSQAAQAGRQFEEADAAAAPAVVRNASREDLEVRGLPTASLGWHGHVAAVLCRQEVDRVIVLCMQAHTQAWVLRSCFWALGPQSPANTAT